MLLLLPYNKRHSYFYLASLFISLGENIDAGKEGGNNSCQLYGQKYLAWQFSHTSWSLLTLSKDLWLLKDMVISLTV